MAGKNNGFYLKIGIYLAGIIFVAGGIFWLVNANANRIDTVEIVIKEVSEKTNTNKGELIGVKKDIENLTKMMDRSYSTQQQILSEIKEIRK